MTAAIIFAGLVFAAGCLGLGALHIFESRQWLRAPVAAPALAGIYFASMFVYAIAGGFERMPAGYDAPTCLGAPYSSRC